MATFNYHFIDNKSRITVKDIENFIEEQDCSFRPSISSKVSIFKYANKLFSLANIIICSYDNKIIGLSAFYCQPKEFDYAFLSYLAVDNSFRGQGIAKELISKMISFCKKKKIKGIKTSTWLGNKVTNLYLSFGFEIIETDYKNSRVELLNHF